jgi:hypothetical protein
MMRKTMYITTFLLFFFFFVAIPQAKAQNMPDLDALAKEPPLVASDIDLFFSIFDNVKNIATQNSTDQELFIKEMNKLAADNNTTFVHIMYVTSKIMPIAMGIVDPDNKDTYLRGVDNAPFKISPEEITLVESRKSDIINFMTKLGQQ